MILLFCLPQAMEREGINERNIGQLQSTVDRMLNEAKERLNTHSTERKQMVQENVSWLDSPFVGVGIAELKITAGHWPFFAHICQMANHFPRWSAAMANALMIMPLFP